jgi:hypothetical protein
MTIEHEQLQFQIRRGSAATLGVQFFDDGVAADPGVVTVGIVDEAGTEVIASGTATDGSGTDPRTYNLAAQSDLTVLIVTWTSATYGAFTSRVEVVGEFLFTLRDARTYDRNALASTDEYPATLLERTRARITDDFAHKMGVSHIPRYRRLELAGSGSHTLFLPDLYVATVREIEVRRSGESTWTAFTADELAGVNATDGGLLIRETGLCWIRDYSYRVTYEYGYPVPPLPVSQAALRLLVSFRGVTQTSTDMRAMRIANEYGEIHLSTPGRGGAIYGIPEVDEVIRDYSEHTIGVA